MANVVATMVFGDEFREEVASRTLPTVEAYAERVGAEFAVIGNEQWARELLELLEQYERVFYLDADCLVRDDCPDVFELVPDHCVGLFDERDYVDADTHCYNTGVMVLSRCHTALLDAFGNKEGRLLLPVAEDVAVQALPRELNWMAYEEDVSGQLRTDAYVIHYAGQTDKVAKIETDLKVWAKRDEPPVPTQSRSMSRNCVVTMAIGQKHERIGALSHPTLREYAERIGADFHVIDKAALNRGAPHFEKLQLFHLLNRYDRVAFMDTDLIVRDDCPDLFEEVPREKIGAFNEGDFIQIRRHELEQASQVYGIPLPPKKWKGHYYNTGVLVVSRVHKYLFDPNGAQFRGQACEYGEQSLLNLRIWQKEFKVHELSYRFNRMTCMDRFTGEDRHASYVIHYAGVPSTELCLELMKKDLTRWTIDSPDYDYGRHVIVEVNGGLGDQVAVEPGVRFIEEQYSDSDIVVLTDWPDVYRHHHKNGVRVFGKYDFKGETDTPFFRVKTLTDPNDGSWNTMSHTLVHPIDFCTLLALKRTIRDDQKTISLPIDLEDLSRLFDSIGIQGLEDYVLVHPGKGWPSKTFPTEWWQAVIDGLVSEGRKVGIIGKYVSDEQGLIELEVPPGVSDFRDLLDLPSLFALISQAKVVVSNDSAPVHIAGAFDNWIVVVPTCKRPEHILPFRHGTQTYKTKVLCKRLLTEDIDSRPTVVHGQTVDWIPGGDILKYLPDPETVVREVCGIFDTEGVAIQEQPLELVKA